jgi:uridine kinase
MDNNNIDMAIDRILDKTNENTHIIAVDGRCCAGKTTLAEKLGTVLGCPIVHMDHFFLRPSQRTSVRYKLAGENVDHERFSDEVLKPLRENKAFSYRPFDCKTQAFREPVRIEQYEGKPVIVEGSYSCHESLWDSYDLRVFMTVDYATQIERLRLRNGEQSLDMFKAKWIPLEEKYFAEFDLEKRCDIVINTSC